MKGMVIRKVTTKECSWLKNDINPGHVVYKCVAHTYGTITPEGVAVTYDKLGDYPFFELPKNAVVWVHD